MSKKTFSGMQPDLVIRSASTFVPDNTGVSIEFDNLLVNLDAAADGNVAEAIYSFHILSELTDARPGVKIDLRYFIKKGPWSIAKLVFLGSESLQSVDFVYGSEVNGDQSITIECPARPEAIGTPFQFTIALFAHRVKTDQTVNLQVDSLDVTIAPT